MMNSPLTELGQTLPRYRGCTKELIRDRCCPVVGDSPGGAHQHPLPREGGDAPCDDVFAEGAPLSGMHHHRDRLRLACPALGDVPGGVYLDRTIPPSVGIDARRG